MADNSLQAVFGSALIDTHIESKSTLNKNCPEFKPLLRQPGDSGSFQQIQEDEYLSTMGSALDELLSRAANSKYQEPPTGSVSPSPIPSTAHATPVMSSVLLPPPPGYDPIVENADLAFVGANSMDGMAYDPSMYSSPTCSWRSYPPPFHLGFKLFVGALPYSVCETDLFPLFSQFGDILELHIQRDWLGRSKGCAWLRYSSMDECDAAIDALHNNYFLGSMNRPMQLTYASDNADRKSTRSRTASYSVQSVDDFPVESAPLLSTVVESRPRAMTDQIPSAVSANSVLGKLRMMMSSTNSSANSSMEITECIQSSTPMKDEGRSLTCLEISGFPAVYTDHQVEELLSQFGPVARLVRVSGSRAEVEFKHPRDAERARSVMDGVTLPACDCPISIN